MASIRFRNNRYEARLRIKGRAISKSFKSHAEAQKWAVAIELGVCSPESHTFDLPFSDALDRYHRESGSLKKGGRQESERIRALKRHRWVNRPMSRIQPSDIRQMRDELLDRGLSGSTIRLLMSTVSVVYKYANSEWGASLVNPVLGVSMPKPPPPRSRRLTPDELRVLPLSLQQCKNAFVLPAYLFSLETGLRQSELLGLTWSDIDYQRGLVHLRDTKNGTPRWIPLTQTAKSVLENLVKTTERVFPITKSLLNQAWGHALGRAGVQGLRWHDLRHEALSRWAHTLRGDVHKLALVSGHKTLQMSLRYVHPVAAEVLAGSTLTVSSEEVIHRT
jgi:integrase